MISRGHTQNHFGLLLGAFCQSALVHAHGGDGYALSFPMAIRSHRRNATLVRAVVVPAGSLEHLCTDPRVWNRERAGGSNVRLHGEPFESDRHTGTVCVPAFSVSDNG